MILVVDDNTLNRMILMKLIRHMGLIGYTATNGLEAIVAVKEKSEINLILMDLMMPVMDGYEATRKIREFKSINSLPIVAVTADSTEGLLEKCAEVGCNEYITKPIKKEVIEQILKKYLPKT
jgi:CheY-like chemotaxis protein